MLWEIFQRAQKKRTFLRLVVDINQEYTLSLKVASLILSRALYNIKEDED